MGPEGLRLLQGVDLWADPGVQQFLLCDPFILIGSGIGTSRSVSLTGQVEARKGWVLPCTSGRISKTFVFRIAGRIRQTPIKIDFSALDDKRGFSTRCAERLAPSFGRSGEADKA